MIRIQTSQLAILPGNVRDNFANIIEEIKIAKENHTDLLIFPELCLSGYIIGDLWEQPAFLRECERYGEKIAKASQNMTIIFGNIAVDRDKKNRDGRFRKYNAAFIASDGAFIHGKLPYIIKTLLPNYRQFNEVRYFTNLYDVARENAVSVNDLLCPIPLSIGGQSVKIGVLLCEDSWDENAPFSPMSVLAKKGADILVNLSASPFALGKSEKRHRLFKNSLSRLHRPLLYINRRGFENNGKNCYVYDGMSAAYDSDGHLLFESVAYQEKRSVFHFDIMTREIIPEKKFTPGYENLLLASLRYGIKEFLSSIGTEKVVIGISGGIDSAVNAALYRSVIPGEKLLLVNTPSIFNSETTKRLARQISGNLETYFAEIPITPFIDAAVASLDGLKITSPTGEKTLHISGFMKENMQARDRSSRILSALSAAFGGIFTCNANKTELSVGYGTLYGDLAGALAATADLWKHQVYELGNSLNNFYGQDVIPKETFSIKPSAELSENQDINKGLGDPLIYEYHDFLFRAFTETWQRITPEEILLWYSQSCLEKKIGAKIDINTVFDTPAAFINDLEKWWNLFSGFAVAKRIQSPPLLSVSRRSFGNDLRESQIHPYYTDSYLDLKKKILSK